MEAIKSFADELGPAWLIAVACTLVFSLFFRTWIIIGAIAGALITLYIHPYETQFQSRPHAFSEKPTAVAEEGNDSKDERITSIATEIPPRLRKELAQFSDNTIMDYVKWWFCPPNFPVDESFPAQCRSSLNFVLNQMYFSVRRKDPILYFDTIFTSSVATLGVALEDLRTAYKLRSDGDPVGLARFVMLHPHAALSRMLDHREQQENLRRRADDFLNKFARKNDLTCLPVAAFMQQILAVSVFETSLRNLAHRDSLNAYIISTLTEVSNTRSETAAKTQLADVLDGVTQEVADAAAVGDVVKNDEAVIDEDDFAVEAQSISISTPEARPQPRGRRLSFKNKSISSISDIGLDEDGKRKSFLRRTGSLLSKSRSRSSSPVKELEGAAEKPTSPGHTRSRSISPFKWVTKAATNSDANNLAARSTATPSPERATLFNAELIVTDISDIKPTNFNGPIPKNDVPKYSILISPVKQEGYGSSAGIGIFRSILDICDLDRKLRAAAKTGGSSGPINDLHRLPDWRRQTFADLEIEILTYLTSVTRIKTLAELKPFREFCRTDLVSEDRTEDRREDEIVEHGKTVLTDVAGSTDLAAPSGLTTAKKDPRKGSTMATEVSTHQRSADPEVAALLELKENIARSTTTTTATVDPETSTQDSYEAVAKSSGVDLKRVDFQNLVSQSMELLSAFFSLSSRTWTIRKQLLNLLRNLLLSRNSVYSATFLDWLDTALFRQIASADAFADLMLEANKFLFPETYVKPEPLSAAQSLALQNRARQLFVAKGMPSAIRNLMGIGPTNEALGILFDALQDPDFSLGLLSILFSEALKMVMID